MKFLYLFSIILIAIFGAIGCNNSNQAVSTITDPPSHIYNLPETNNTSEENSPLEVDSSPILEVDSNPTSVLLSSSFSNFCAVGVEWGNPILEKEILDIFSNTDSSDKIHVQYQAVSVIFKEIFSCTFPDQYFSDSAVDGSFKENYIYVPYHLSKNISCGSTQLVFLDKLRRVGTQISPDKTLFREDYGIRASYATDVLDTDYPHFNISDDMLIVPEDIHNKNWYEYYFIDIANKYLLENQPEITLFEDAISLEELNCFFTAICNN